MDGASEKDDNTVRCSNAGDALWAIGGMHGDGHNPIQKSGVYTVLVPIGCSREYGSESHRGDDVTHVTHFGPSGEENTMHHA